MNKEMAEEENEMRAIPFIQYKEGEGFILSEESEQFLGECTGKLGIISIVGKYRTGKSFFVNRVLLNQQKNGFRVGATINPCTKGLWLWKQKIKCEQQENQQQQQQQDLTVLVIDTEGFGGIDENVNHDTRIFLFSILLSSYFIYNSVGSIDETAIQNLSVIVNLTKDIQIKSKTCENDEDDMSQYFPQFLWIIRDFALRMTDSLGNRITSKEYLEQALSLQKGVSDSIEAKNRIRRMLKHVFRERDCATLIRPLESENDLQRLNELPDSVLRNEFNESIKILRNKIFKKVKPKILNGQFINGPMLLEIAKAYINTINTGGVPNIQNAWQFMCKNECKKSLHKSLEFIQDKLYTIHHTKDRFTKEELSQIKIQLSNEILENFRNTAIGSQEQLKLFQQDIEKQFNEIYKKFIQQNKQKWFNYYLNYLNISSENIIEKLKEEKYQNLYEFQLDFSKLCQEYNNKTDQSKWKAEALKEFSIGIYDNSIERLFKKIEQDQQQQLKKIQMKQETLENEIQMKRKDHENDKQEFMQRMQQLEGERAILKSNEKYMNEKMNQMNQEKEKLEQMYQEINEKLKENEIQNKQQYQCVLSEKDFEIDSIKKIMNQQNSDFQQQNALLKQEIQFLSKEISHLHDVNSNLNLTKNLLADENKNIASSLEECKQTLHDNLQIHQQEFINLKFEYEKKLQECHYQQEKKNELSKQTNEWKTEKNYLDNQIQFMNSQLEESRRHYDALLKAFQENMKSIEQESKNELLELNKNLSIQLEKSNYKCKLLEQKNNKLKQAKRIVKNSISVQCKGCKKQISTQIFESHIIKCEATKLQTENDLQQQQQQLYILSHNEQITIKITQMHIRYQLDNGKPYTEYEIQVNYPQKNKIQLVTIYKTFKEFCALNQQLSNMQLELVNLPEIGIKLFGGVISSEFLLRGPGVVEDRKKNLEQYLNELAMNDIINQSKVFQEFLQNSQNNKENLNQLQTSSHVNAISCKVALVNTSFAGRPPSTTEIDIHTKVFTQSPLSFLKTHEHNKQIQINQKVKTSVSMSDCADVLYDRQATNNEITNISQYDQVDNIKQAKYYDLPLNKEKFTILKPTTNIPFQQPSDSLTKANNKPISIHQNKDQFREYNISPILNKESNIKNVQSLLFFNNTFDQSSINNIKQKQKECNLIIDENSINQYK